MKSGPGVYKPIHVLKDVRSKFTIPGVYLLSPITYLHITICEGLGGVYCRQILQKIRSNKYRREKQSHKIKKSE